MNTTKPKLLVIDDEEKFCRTISRVAEKSGFDTKTLNNPSSFNQVITKFTPDIIFLDLKMPEIDGIQLLSQLNEKQRQSDIYFISGVDPSILATAYRIAKKNGFSIKGILTKPLDWSKIIEIFGSYSNTIKPSISNSPSKTPKESNANEDIKISEFDLDYAIKHSQFFLQYQPKIALGSGKVVGAEALARWVHPKMGNIPPTLFIPFAENCNQIKSLTFFLISHAISDYRLLKKKLGNFKLSFNISAILLEDENFPDQITEYFNEGGVSPDNVILEITETENSDEDIISMGILSRLRIKGFELSIDDYGTGYASLSKLLAYPFSELKIDKKFIMAIKDDEDSRMLVQSTIDMANKFNLKTVAEGIEDSETLRWLIKKGCAEGQGYHLCRPKSAINLIQWHQEKVLDSNLNNTKKEPNLDIGDFTNLLSEQSINSQ